MTTPQDLADRLEKVRQFKEALAAYPDTKPLAYFCVRNSELILASLRRSTPQDLADRLEKARDSFYDVVQLDGFTDGRPSWCRVRNYRFGDRGTAKMWAARLSEERAPAKFSVRIGYRR